VSPSKSNWFSIPYPKPNAKLRLICLPYAGGNAAIYHQWSNKIINDIELISLQPPGRSYRLQETPFNDMEKLIDDLMQVLPSILDKPYVIFGHSLGSRIGFELIHRCQSLGLRLPDHFIASGSRGPQVPCLEEQSYHLPDDQFILKLKEMDGTPEELLNSKELMALLLPMIKADFQIAETYRFSGNLLLDIPISVFGGTDDDKVNYQNLEAWQQYFSQPTNITLFSGGHFFINSHQTEVVDLVNTVLARVINLISHPQTAIA
jgi:medium-chain acyl-[acyl-carrier-protein] hydrolase